MRIDFDLTAQGSADDFVSEDTIAECIEEALTEIGIDVSVIIERLEVD